MADEAASLLNLAEIEGRGRALVAAQRLRGGQIVLRDSPILLYSALPITKQPPSSSSSATTCYCANCFKILPQSSSSQAVSCPTCDHHAFCSPSCLSAAVTTSHTPWVCQALSRLVACPLLDGQPLERHVQARFLIAACNLATVSPSNFQLLLSLQGREAHTDDTISAAQFLHSLLASVCPPPPPASPFPQGFSFEMIVALLSRDKLNAFGLMEPVSSRDGDELDGERSVRAYGIYPRASFFNHDCLPNACRFDYVDSASDGNTDIIVRIIHDVPQGREICLSYFPVNLNYANRQRRLMEDYGFACDCDRCKVEANWSDDENEHGDNREDNDGDTEGMNEDADEQMGGLEAGIGEEKETDFPHAYFFLRYMCNRENCGGTMAPLPPSECAPSNRMECNVCGQLRNEDEEAEADGEEAMDE
ncbi:histone-lysine N-methyltransferase ASHR2 [Rhodamnia argentea]|uniref:Histone-lysine N-methyltransferase ASHR2 n=1 Tax=Rhodamnia argentea TaxID=178133 RepID=A0A8B8NPH8_9MYRT|nr:histone-lysine N-methyltransferase ASHR2 [Rhodamnia argentea]